MDLTIKIRMVRRALMGKTIHSKTLKTFLNSNKMKKNLPIMMMKFLIHKQNKQNKQYKHKYSKNRPQMIKMTPINSMINNRNQMIFQITANTDTILISLRRIHVSINKDINDKAKRNEINQLNN